MTDYDAQLGRHKLATLKAQDRIKRRCQAMHATMQSIIDNLVDGSDTREILYSSLRKIQESADMLYEEACYYHTPRLELRVAKLETIIDGLIQ